MTSMSDDDAFRLGRSIAVVVEAIPLQQFIAGRDPESFSAAQVTVGELFTELRLLCMAAALWTIQSQPLSSRDEKNISDGLRDWVRTLGEPEASYISESLQEACEFYAESARRDVDETADTGQFSYLELALADYLFARGPEIEARANACASLSYYLPKMLWSAAIHATSMVFRDAELLLDGNDSSKETRQ